MEKSEPKMSYPLRIKLSLWNRILVAKEKSEKELGVELSTNAFIQMLLHVSLDMQEKEKQGTICSEMVKNE